MIRHLVAATITMAAGAPAADSLTPGRWDIRSSTTEMSVPGLPSFIARMMQGRSKVEHKRLGKGEGVEALLAPDPKAKCHVDVQRVAAGTYHQALTCPQKDGQAVQVIRTGSYDKTGFAGVATITGKTAKGPMRIVLAQRASRSAADQS